MTLKFDSGTWSRRTTESEKRAYRRASSTDADIERHWTLMKMAGAAKITAVEKQALPFLQGLIVTVGTRGANLGSGWWLDVDDFYKPLVDFDANNTPENRRVLHTLLQALIECPRTWARSAVQRHLRGTGKQKETKYTGNGVFGTGSGWKEDETTLVMKVLMGTTNDRGLNISTADVLCMYVEGFEDLNEEAWEAAGQAWENGKDVNPFAVTQTKRNVRFLKNLSTTLEHMGLGPEMARPAPKVKKTRKAKTFKVGDKVTTRNMRDVPVGGRVEVTQKARTEGRLSWVKTFTFLGRVTEKTVPLDRWWSPGMFIIQWDDDSTPTADKASNLLQNWDGCRSAKYIGQKKAK